MLREVWTRLYQLAHEAGNGEDSGVASLNKHILSSLKPDKTMVFVLDLMSSGRSPRQHVVPPSSCSHFSSVEKSLPQLVCTANVYISRILP